MMFGSAFFLFFFFNDPATTEIYTLSLHDALPIWRRRTATTACKSTASASSAGRPHPTSWSPGGARPDRKSTRLNSSHVEISYAVFCLKKKKQMRELFNDLQLTRTYECLTSTSQYC